MFEKLKDWFDKGKESLTRSLSLSGEKEFSQEDEFDVDELIEGAREYVDSILVTKEGNDDKADAGK